MISGIPWSCASCARADRSATSPDGSATDSQNNAVVVFVGLKGGWGEILGGYQYTTLYRISTLSGSCCSTRIT